MKETSETNQMAETFEMFPLETFQMPTSSLEDFLVQLFQLRENEQGSLWRTLEAHSLLKCLGSLGIKEYRTFYLRMSKDSSPQMVEKPFQDTFAVQLEGDGHA